MKSGEYALFWGIAFGIMLVVIIALFLSNNKDE